MCAGASVSPQKLERPQNMMEYYKLTLEWKDLDGHQNVSDNGLEDLG